MNFNIWVCFSQINNFKLKTLFSKSFFFILLLPNITLLKSLFILVIIYIYQIKTKLQNIIIYYVFLTLSTVRSLN